MQGTSDAWNQAVTQSHHVSARVDVCEPSGTVLASLPIESGEVQMDSTADSERHLTCEAIDEDGKYTPGQLEDLLAPNGNELRAWMGLAWPGPLDKVGEVPLGVFGINDVDVDSSGAGNSISLDAYDRAKTVSQAGFDYPVYVGPTYDADGNPVSYWNKAQAIITILLTRVPWLTILFDQTITDQVIYEALTFQNGDDPWQKCRDIATSMGKELYFNALGQVALRNPVDPTTAPVVWKYTDGVDATILDLGKKFSAENTCSGVFAVSTASQMATGVDTPVAYFLWDTDPLSPTYYLGKFGKRLKRWESSLINTVEQAQQAAQVVLNQYKGLLEDVQFTAVTNPAHEVGDVVEVSLPEARVINKYVLQTLTIPLGSDGDMQATTKLARVLPAVSPVAIVVRGAAKLDGLGTMTAAARRHLYAAAALTGTGTLGAAYHSHLTGAAALLGNGLLNDRGVIGRVGGAMLTGSGTLSTAGFGHASGACGLSGSGALAAAGTRRFYGAAALTGNGSLSDAGVVTRFGASGLAGSGSLGADGLGDALAAADLEGSGDMTATAA